MKSEIKSGGWTRSPPEVLSNPNHSVIQEFFDTFCHVKLCFLTTATGDKTSEIPVAGSTEAFLPCVSL